MPHLRLRPPRHARPLPGMRDASRAATRGRIGRVKRRLFNLAVAVSLLICITTCVMWARSRYALEGLAVHGHAGEVVLGYNDGRFQLSVCNIGRVPPGLDRYSNDV